jgi:hypothetical protein
MKNQCDGCRRGLPLKGNIHIDPKYPRGSYGRLYMVCTRNLYTEKKPPISGTSHDYYNPDPVWLAGLV